MGPSSTARTNTAALTSADAQPAPLVVEPADSARSTSDSFWRSLGYFNYYRLALAGVFLLTATIAGLWQSLGSYDRPLFLAVNLTYLAIAFVFVVTHSRRWLRFDVLLTLQVFADVAALTLLMYASGGIKSGLAVMLLVVLAGAGLVGQGRLTLFYAALAALALLAEHAYRMLAAPDDAVDFGTIAVTCIAFFATAIVARLLARRVIANEELARERGVDLVNQLWINERIIRDLQDGVLVVTGQGKVRQYNPQAAALLEVRPPSEPDLGAFSVALAEAFCAFDARQGEQTHVIAVAGTTRTVRARLVGAGRAGDVLVYLEDLARIKSQAQQLKLAALGRLTGNIAHEIRNPLAAIMHASELAREEKRGDMLQRLMRIVIDNAMRLERIVRDVLEVGRRDRVEAETLVLEAFLSAFLDEFCLHEKAERSVFALELQTGATLLFDRAHINQVLWNLLSNALRYCSGAAGAICLRAAGDAGANRCELHIIDDGPGIPDTLRGQVFEPFFTTHSKGTGLGLFIARELCDANQAILELLEATRGAHFRIIGRKQ